MPICPKCRETNPALGARCPRDGYYYVYESALEQAENDPLIGTQAADKYVILDLISEGGMGAVYRALQLPVEREVALKMLRTELQDSHQGKERFIQEARAISRLSHPNIITLHDFGFEDNDHPYMVMEYAPGQELTQWMWSDDMTAQRLIHVIRQILSALSEAHQNNIVHRDLKPENVIILRTGGDPDFVKLLDFGIARVITEGATRGLTREGEVFGTPHYMSPEQAQGKRKIGPPSDVYALGIMLHEFFTGLPPFDAEAPLSVLFKHINDPMPELIPREGLELPDGIAQIVSRATEKKAEDRYQDATEMLAALDDALGMVDRSGSFAVSRSSAPDDREQPDKTDDSPQTRPTVEKDLPADSDNRRKGRTDVVTPGPISRDASAGPVIDDVSDGDSQKKATAVQAKGDEATEEIDRDEKKPPVALLLAALIAGLAIVAVAAFALSPSDDRETTEVGDEIATSAEPGVQEDDHQPVTTKETDSSTVPDREDDEISEFTDQQEELEGRQTDEEIQDEVRQAEATHRDQTTRNSSTGDSPRVAEETDPPAATTSRQELSSPEDDQDQPESEDEDSDGDTAEESTDEDGPRLFERPGSQPTKFDRPTSGE